jgi:PTS system mannitol-specific IIC component
MSVPLPDARVNKNLQGPGARATVQRFGGYLAGMIMPNIGAFIAWGLITALFIPTGWLPNATLAELVGPIITYLLPVLIGYTGGRMVHGQRGAVIGAIATMGVVVGVNVEWLGSGVQALVNAHLLPLASIFVEPAKVLFLNNAINHGVLSPLGAAQAQTAGKSILFMVESNPGPGLGLLLAFMLFGPISLRPSTPGAIIIHFFGGIHEIYFPYVLMKPKMILAVIAGGMSGLFVGSILGAGLVAPASPGSIIAYFAVTPRSGYLPMIADVLVATAVSFAVASALFGFGHGAKAEAEAEAVAAVPETPTTAWTPPGTAGTSSVATATTTRTINGRDVKRLVIACDAGMGSSVMVASAMKKKLASSGVEVTHTPVNGIPADAQLILCHSGLLDRARKIAPATAVIVPFEQFMGDPAFTMVENAIKNGETLES